MSQEEDQLEDLRALETALAALVPCGDRLDRDRLMFLAGRATGAQPPPAVPHRWAWPTAFSTMTALAASLLVMLVVRPGPQIVERIIEVPTGAVRGSGDGASDPRTLLAGERLGDSLPESALARSSDETALALGPLARLRSTELSGRLAAMADPAWLDQVLAVKTDSPSARSKGPEDRELPQAPATYRQMRDRLLDAPGADREPRPPVPELFRGSQKTSLSPRERAGVRVYEPATPLSPHPTSPGGREALLEHPNPLGAWS